MKKIHVYDLDGVLVDTSHRYRNKPDGSIDLEYWLAHRHKLDADELLPLAAQYAADCDDPDVYTILCTAREYHILDVQYIYRDLGVPDKLMMRALRDDTPDAKLKYRGLVRLFNLRQFAKLPRFLWEDNKRNIAALSRLFTRCYYVPSHIKDNTA